MDDKNKDTLAGGGLGALVGGALAGPAGAATVGIAGAVMGSHEKKHNDTLREIFYELDDVMNGDGKIYVDHIDPSGAESGGTQNRIEAVSGVPDLISIAQRYPNLIIEVETVEAIENNSSHVIKQLNDFQTQGFKRVLVAPEGEVDEFLEWAERYEQKGRINQEVTIATPGNIGAIL
jgi:hypothetical protein